MMGGDEEDDELINQMLDKDQIKDLQAKQFLEDLKQVGPYSKQILNYTYPPLLYQRGEEDENEDEEDGDNELAQQDDDDEEDNAQEIQKIISGAGAGGIKNEELYKKLSQVVRDKEAQQYIEQEDEDGNVYLVEAFENEDDEEANGEDEDEDGEGQYVFRDGGDEDYDDQDMEGFEGQQMMIDGDEMEDEEFLQMMEQQALSHKLRYAQIE